ncbi:MAG: aspartyl/asparaginyl beta-hydroxylase domain-containing protein [Verrucomicrobia bacterium]|nr:aspartyl/asparaginyl beta-hydroxylase domain-containing protein [Verrucomicrobiota bacterium]
MSYDVEKLSEELEYVSHAYMPRHGSFTNWTAIPLRNATGASGQDGIEIHNTIRTKEMLPCMDTHYLELLPYMASILDDIRDRFDTEIGLVRISKVEHGKSIARHQDGPIFDLDRGTVSRLHIPIITGHDVLFEIASKNYNLEAGHLYYTNVSKTHAVFNNGPFDRIHLIIDVHTSQSLRDHIRSYPEIES